MRSLLVAFVHDPRYTVIREGGKPTCNRWLAESDMNRTRRRRGGG